MKVIKASYEILTPFTGHELEFIEQCGRTCYKSGDRFNDNSARPFVSGLVRRGDESVLEHLSLSVRFTCDRGVSHELVRHRLASFSQESTRYCNYSDERFGSELTFIDPCFPSAAMEMHWLAAMEAAEKHYMELIALGTNPQWARSVLPNSVKTEVVMTANYREWRHFFRLRAARETGPAHPQMEELARPLLAELKEKLPVIFDDIVVTGQ